MEASDPGCQIAFTFEEAQGGEAEDRAVPQGDPEAKEDGSEEGIGPQEAGQDTFLEEERC